MNFDDSRIAGCSEFGRPPSVSGPESPEEIRPGGPHPIEEPILVSSDPPKDPPAVASIVNPAEAQNDIAACSSSTSRASTCCSNPSACGAKAQAITPAPPADGAGMAAYCHQMQAAALTNAQSNNSAAAVCSSATNGCSSSCSAKVAKYESLAASCAGKCADADLIARTLQSLQASSLSCSRYSSLVAKLGQQAGQTANTSGVGDRCSELTKALPFSSQDKGSEMPLAKDSSETAVAARESESFSNGKSGFDETNKENSKSSDSFNLSTGSSAQAARLANSKIGNAPTYKGIPNSDGKGVPGEATGPATLGPRASKTTLGYNTNVLGGVQGASSYTTQSLGSGLEENELNGKDAQAAAREPAADENDKLVGLDLKQYLPGARNAAGNGGREDLLGPYDNIWERITIRMTEKCKLGRLYECYGQ